MEKETSISKEFLSELAKEMKEKYKVNFWFAEIFGNRWSYLTGEKNLSGYLTERFQLSEKLGVVINDWGKISEKDKENLISFIRERMRQKEVRL